MNSQRDSWEKSTQRQDDYSLKRGVYRVILNAQAAVAADQSAIHHNTGYKSLCVCLHSRHKIL